MAKKTSPVSFYLGDPDEKERRINSLEGIAEKFGMTRSVLLQKIADGDFDIQPTPLERVREGLEDIKAGRFQEIASARDIFHDD